MASLPNAENRDVYAMTRYLKWSQTGKGIAEVSITIQQLVLLNGNMAPLNAVWRIRRHLSPERSSDVQEAVLGTTCSRFRSYRSCMAIR